MSVFRLPFGPEPGWRLWNGNWDDPGGKHGAGQAYAFDFGYDPLGIGAGIEGQPILAARAGTVVVAKSWQQDNTWGEANQSVDRGSGNYVVIRHADGTVSTYCHLMPDEVSVKADQWVPQGLQIARCGNTGNSSTPHLHYDVVSYWFSTSDFGASLPVRFQDAKHAGWRPRSGDVLTSNNTTTRQDGWHFCRLCRGIFFGSGAGSTCPAAGEHDASESGNYSLMIDVRPGSGQSGWRWCRNCTALFFGDNPTSACPAGGPHVKIGSGNYTIAHNAQATAAAGQLGWRWCSKCQGMFFGNGPGSACSTGGAHSAIGSGAYAIWQQALPDVQSDWRWCSKCQGMFFGGNAGSVCPAGGSHVKSGTKHYLMAHASTGAPGQAGWRWCAKCEGMFFGDNPGSRCPAGGAHTKTDSGNYAVVQNAEDGPGQAEWRWCAKCQGMFFGGNPSSSCPTGGSHVKTGSGNYRPIRSAK